MMLFMYAYPTSGMHSKPPGEYSQEPILCLIAKLPESGDTSDDITECDVWKDLAEAEG